MISTRLVPEQLLLLIPVLMGMASFVFFVLHLSPGDPALTIVGECASEEFARQVEESLGPNDLTWVQYGRLFVSAMQFQFGESFVIQRNTMVREVPASKLPVTLEPALYGQLIGISLNIPFGIPSAVEQDNIIDHLTRIGAFTGISVFIFWSGLLLILLFTQVFGWFLMGGHISVLHNVETTRVMGLVMADVLLADNWNMFVSMVHYMTLPTLVIGVYSMAFISQMTRSSMLEVIRQSYMRTVRVKGQGAKATALKHGFRNAMTPAITVTGIQFGDLLGGVILTGTVFIIDGTGILLVEAIKVGDYPVVQGMVLTFAFLPTLVNPGADITYSILDPWIEQ